MFGLNWIDLTVILLLLASIWGGVKMGVVNQFTIVGCGFAAFFLAGWLLPHVLPIHDRTLKTIINSNLVLLISAYAAVKGFDLSRRMHWNLGRRGQNNPRLRMLDGVLGCMPALIGSLLAVWLLGTMFMRMPLAGLSNSISSSKLIQVLNDELPPVPRFVAVFDRQINPNAQPYVFAQPKPSSNFNYSLETVNQAAVAAQNSVARITSFGCGGIVTGSGFAIGPNLVMTNAHVIAGVKWPIVKYQGQSYAATPVIFDVSRDIAVLRLTGFKAPPLKPAAQSPAADSTVAIIGFPGGNYTISPGIIRNNLTVFGRNIYDQGLLSRQIYEIQSRIDFGSSGSPVVTTDGKLAGMVFSKSTNPPNYAYALTADELKPTLTQAATARQRVGTGACLAS